MAHLHYLHPQVAPGIYIDLFQACATYESTTLEFEDFPRVNEDVWILGKKYNLQQHRNELHEDIRSRLLITYRKNFTAIGGTGPTSDNGWGCMLRCGQMILAHALICRHLGRDWRWKPNEHNSDTYTKILKSFLDRKDSCYSIHQIAQMGVSEGKGIGQWYGPNTVAQVLRKLSLFDDWSSLAIHIAMDNTIVVDDIRKLCTSALGKQKGSTAAANNGASNVQSPWQPLVLFIPLRLGLSEINPLYIDTVKKCFTIKQSIGMIGGKPNHAHYFIGYYKDTLVYLDPHTTQPAVDINKWAAVPDQSYHTKHASRMNVMHLDPSIALGFFCKDEDDFNDLCKGIRMLVVEGQERPMFELTEERPSHWPPFQPSSRISDRPLGAVEATYDVPDVTYDTDEEFELL
ncbi:cysteine protease ATG4B-like isoform X2 [Ptychodera flava]|uniref:cysteine protease ATG4B-like isoform X2 n=1 Tax=Ptychodera flava TaxID=63121 RepID=UPI00396AAD7B